MAQLKKVDDRWVVSGDLTIEHAQKLLIEIDDFPMGNSLVIDLSQVTQVDTATISLMFEWLRKAQVKKCDLRFSNFSKNLLSLITLYGVVDLIPQAAH